MLKTWRSRSVIGVIIVIVVFIMTAPASLMKKQITSQLPGTQISAVSGKFLSGDLQQIIYQGVEIKNLSWDVSLLALFTASLGIDLTIDDTLFNGTASVKRGLSDTTTFTNINARQSVTALSQLSPALKMLSPTGELIWQDVAVTVDAQTFSEAAGELHLNNLSINLNGEQFSLGSVNAIAGIDQNDLLLKLTGDAVLDVQGTVRISRDRTYQLSISVQQQIPEKLYTALRYMARPDADGRLVFNFSGRW